MGICLCFTGTGYGDWIKATFSPRAKIDSINRFLVLSDSRDSTFFGYGIVPAGDINKDGYPDVIICRSKNSYAYADDTAFLFLGGSSPSLVPARSYSHLKFWMANIGDVNHDGYADFGLIDLPLTNFKLFLGGSGQFDTIYQGLSGFNSHIAPAADLDGDGRLEIALAKSLAGGSVYIYSVDPVLDTVPKYIINDTSTGFGFNLTTGDFNGDGYPDLVVAAALNRDTDLIKFYWGGPHFDTVPGLVLKRKALSAGSAWGERLLNVGDFNGDGIDDIYIGGNYPQADGVHFGGSTIHDKPDVVINSDMSGGYNVLTYVTVAGDINHDGYPDIISSYNIPISYNAIFIHLGGPTADSVPDVVINDYDIPGSQYFLGWVTAGVGDFNGDGVDDFAVYSRTSYGCCWRSQVNFFAGWNSNPTDVRDHGSSSLPQLVRLLPPYPNPCNGGSTIEFELQSTGPVRLSVLNVLGQEVRTLIDGAMRAGSHRVHWNARDRAGLPVASGVYVVRLQQAQNMCSEKITVLK